MYLKRIEMHGFKSFSNKIVLEFHNGITGIVGPNGSGKSNISDAVRWVLGEQSARQLRGASMQDVIFAGTQSRKALSFAYVALTLDNSDHILPYEYEEVTVSRRVYRSGESEYHINKVPCRLRDIQELFYDTGIGKEGYSIIGQGQIERILSSKPEDRRELFDEAVGIVKYKKRKDASLKRLEEERANLERITDILDELNRRIGPLEAQSKAAKRFVELRGEQKLLEVNLYLLENERLREEEKGFISKRASLESQLSSFRKENEEISKTYEAFALELEELDKKLVELRSREMDTTKVKGNLSTQIELCREQISSAKQRLEECAKRSESVSLEKMEHEKQLLEYEDKKKDVEALLSEVTKRLEEANAFYKSLDDTIKEGSEKVDKLNNELINLIRDRTELKSSKQRYDTMIEQENINKSQLNQRQLAQKTKHSELVSQKESSREVFERISNETKALEEKGIALVERKKELASKSEEIRSLVEEKKSQQAVVASRLDNLKNISERYEGYGHAIRRVMEKKDDNPGVVGVIADLISVDKKYETAIETALGGNIQNVVTEDEDCARSMIEFLKKNKFGRVTFLPITSVKNPRELHGHDILSEPEAIGLACDLVSCDKKFNDVITYLLGRIVVCESIDSGLSLARKYKYGHHIVTLDGEYLRPGGSITGGSFKNTSNLLSRNREIDELEKKLDELEAEITEGLNQREEYNTAIELLNEDIEKGEEEYRNSLLEMNTAKLHMESAISALESAKEAAKTLVEEREELEHRLIDISVRVDEATLQISESEKKEVQLKENIKEIEDLVDEKRYMESTAARNLSEIQIEEASARQEVRYVDENINRIKSEIEKDISEEKALLLQREEASKEALEKERQIEEITSTIKAADDSYDGLLKEIEEAQEKKEKMSERHLEFFNKKEELSLEISRLEKEEVRLDLAEEKIKEESRNLNNHMWNEYEITLHSAMEMRDESLSDTSAIKKSVSSIREEIRGLGDVNVAAIDEYAEVAERHGFLTNQYNDIVEAEKRLLEIIDELDTGMRERFSEGFDKISKAFDEVFKELFGGGKGTLELADSDDILESGIRIIAQPPGKKLQNMMQLSGGEKSFTAIALLFAILSLKPTPFCLLDEIEAALDEPNVDRFAKYLNKLTDHTQFIIITHRRGTMNAADRLYGITMQEKGISTLVSVNLIEDELEE